MHGVRQAVGRDVCASAPGGSDSIVSETLAPLVMLLGRKFQLGVREVQLAASKALAMAQTRTKGVICTYVPRPRARTIRGEQSAPNQNLAFGASAEIIATRHNLLPFHSLYAVRKPPQCLPNTRTGASISRIMMTMPLPMSRG